MPTVRHPSATDARRGILGGATAMKTWIAPHASNSASAPALNVSSKLSDEIVNGEMCASRAERGAHRGFTAMCFETHEKKICDVRRGHEQDERDGTEDHPEHTRGRAHHFGLQAA